MRLCALVLVFALTACRAPTTAPRRPALDFDALPGPTTFSPEATLLERWAGPLKAAHDAGERGSFKGVADVDIAYLVHRVPNEKAAVVLLTGRTEPIRKYAELLDDLQRAGFSTFAMDHRGQGASGRLLPNPQRGYVVSFDDYVTDLHTFITTVVRPATSKKVFVVAHSMGGAVAVLANDLYPADADGLVLSSPMLEINTGAFPAPIASTLGAAACGASDGAAYAIGSSDFREETDFEKSTVTKSLPRFEWKRLLFNEAPELRLGGITWRWLCESLTASSYAEQLGRYSATPTLILQAGQDSIVKPGGQKRYCDAAPACQLTVIDEALHEHFAERDALRNRAVERTLKFLEAEVAR
ncbi:MAG: alpha/beta fold hydrolase [Myxococcaceae bacterium]|nr:alpha/beta fold hydrolase [Myxococcaceae bacterium]